MNLDIRFPENNNTSSEEECKELANILQYHLKVPLQRDLELEDESRWGMLKGVSLSNLPPQAMGALHTIFAYFKEQKPFYQIMIQDGNNLHEFGTLPLEEFKAVANRAGNGTLNMSLRTQS